MRLVRMPTLPEKQLSEAVKYEARLQFPIPMEQLVWDFQTFLASLESRTESKEFSTTPVLMIAAKREQITARNEDLASVGQRRHFTERRIGAL